MSVTTSQILLSPPRAISKFVSYIKTAKNTQYDAQYESRYPFIGESAWPVKHQHHVYIRHHFLLIDSGRTQMPSMAFGGGLAGLTKGTAAEGHENQNQQDKG
jgi:hypothetical protein